MMLEWCKWCGGDADPSTTCPRAVACPSCQAQPGQPCIRPSGHRAAQLHAPRIAAAETAPAQLELARQAPAGAVDGFATLELRAQAERRGVAGHQLEL